MANKLAANAADEAGAGDIPVLGRRADENCGPSRDMVGVEE